MSGHSRFVLRRVTDVTGVSGTGIVAEGVEFRDGTVALRWISQWPTSVVFHDRGVEAVEAVHGHGGSTEVVWLDATNRDPSVLARECADLRDQLATARGETVAVRDQLSVVEDDRLRLQALLDEHGIKDPESWL